MIENKIGTRIVESAIGLHRSLGPGLLESVYEATLAKQLEKHGVEVAKQVSIPFKFDEGFGANLIKNGITRAINGTL